MLALLREITFRHLRHSPGRALLVLFGIALGVAMYVATVAVNRSVLDAFQESVARVGGREDLVITNGDVGVPAELIEEAAETPGVAHAAGTLEVITSEPEGGGPLLVLAVDLLGDKYFLPYSVEEGGEDVIDDPVSFVNDPAAILISKKLAERRGKKPGDTIVLLTSTGTKALSIRGILSDEGPAAAFDGQVALMFLEAAQLTFDRGDRVSRVDVAIEKKAKLEDVQGALAKLASGAGRVEKPEARGGRLDASVGPFQLAIRLSGFIALWVGMFLIYNAVGVSVAQRQREIGILRALGVPRARVVLLFCLEALVIAVLGSVVGLLLGSVMAHAALDTTAPNVSRFYAAIRPQVPRITGRVAVEGILVGLAATALASYFPARRAAKVDPVETLRRSRGTGGVTKLPQGLLLGGAAVIAAIVVYLVRVPDLNAAVSSMLLCMASASLIVPLFVVLLCRSSAGLAERLFGIPGRLAVDNVSRSLWRSAPTVASLMLSVAASLSVATWGNSIEHSMLTWLDGAIPADILITAGSPTADRHNVPFDPRVLKTLEGAPGVRSVDGVRIVYQDYGQLRMRLGAAMTSSYLKEQRERSSYNRVTEGRPLDDPSELTRKPLVLIAENTARKLKLGPGDTMTFDTPSGSRSFEVRAVIVDYSSDQAYAMIDRRWYVEYWKDPLIDTVHVYLEKGAEPAEVVSEIKRRLGRGNNLFVMTSTEFKEEVRHILVQSTALMRSTDVIALIVALLGVVGTMLAAVLDRVREIGVLRAVGATQDQVTGAVVAESAFMGLAASIAGILAGVPMGLILVKVVAIQGSGWHVDYMFPWMIALRLAVVVVMTAAIAGWVPGLRAARMDVPEALAYE